MKKILLLAIILTIPFIVFSNNLEIWSDSAIIIDYETDIILYKKNINAQLPPASMTKLVTIYILYKDIEEGLYSKSTLVPINELSDWRNLPRDSSLMFLEEGHKVTVDEIMKGLAISSGNDAAIAISNFVSGSEEEFVKRMNYEMKALGFKKLKFDDPSGFSDENQVNVLEFAQFCKILIKKYPQSLKDLFSLNSFTYPSLKNGNATLGPIKQNNRNRLIGNYYGCDGLKTGYINKSGMNIAVTAKKNNRRVIGVLIGAKDKNKNKADKKREEDAIKLLDYSFTNYTYLQLDKIQLSSIKIENIDIKPIIPYKSKILFRSITDINYDLIKLSLPIFNNQIIGTVTFNSGFQEYNYPIIANKIIH